MESLQKDVRSCLVVDRETWSIKREEFKGGWARELSQGLMRPKIESIKKEEVKGWWALEILPAQEYIGHWIMYKVVEYLEQEEHHGQEGFVAFQRWHHEHFIWYVAWYLVTIILRSKYIAI